MSQRLIEDNLPLEEYLQSCEEAAREGGRILQSWQGRIRPREKGPNDLVTEADFASQQAIAKMLLDRYPDHLFVGEETDDPLKNWSENPEDNGRKPQFRWIVDPLDGTTNYVHDLRSYAVSIALECRGELLVAVVFDPCSEECFRAARGQGAWMNGQRLEGSGTRRMADALIAVSLATQVSPDSLAIRQFLEIVQVCHSIRRLGSAALNLCYVAAGRLDGYVAASVQPWDVAAGILIAREAGVEITSLGGGPVDVRHPALACTATAELHADVMEVLSRIQ